MTSEERMVIDALISVSKSLNRIAGEITLIRKELSEKNSKTSVSTDTNWVSNDMITESNVNTFIPGSKKSAKSRKWSNKSKKNLDSKSAVENIRDIINGEYIK